MPKLLALSSAIPPHRMDQAFARREMARLCEGQPHLERLIPVFDRTGVDTRHLVHEPEWYLESRSFEERNEDYAAKALELAQKAVRSCLTQSGTRPDEIDHIFVVTTTGLTTPSLDALLASCLGLRPDVRRSPLFGLGCAGGAGALIRACDVLSSRPGDKALVVSVELGSLIFSKQAQTPTDLVGVALFGDGAAAALLGGDDTDGPGIRIAHTRTHLFKDSRHLMGWRFTEDGMRLVLSRDIPSLVGSRVAPVVQDFLQDAGLSFANIRHHILHPGGAKVMSTYRSAFGLSDDALSIARDCMRQFGNLSSAAVLVMLSNLVASGAPQVRRQRPDACARSGIRRGNAGDRVVADVAIAGGGPAGAALAIELGRRGVRVNLYEKARHPRLKACGEGLLPHGVTALRAIAGLPDAPRVRGLRFVAGSASTDADFPEGFGLVVRRDWFDAWLFEKAAATPNVDARMGMPYRSKASPSLSAPTDATHAFIADSKRVVHDTRASGCRLTSPAWRV